MFLNPLLLFGTAAVSVPIIIHLLNRRKFERVRWAAMRFVQISVEQNQRRIQVEDWLLLLVRCLMVALLALALARPAISGSAASGLFGVTPVTAVILIDNSASMESIDGQSSRFDHAKRIAEDIVGTLPAGSSVSVLLASDVTIPVIEQPAFDLSFVREAIGKAQQSDRVSSFLQPLQKAVELLDGAPTPRREIYLITDRQGLGWKQSGDIQKMLADHKTDIRTSVIFVGEAETRNLAVSNLRLASAMVPVGQAIRFEVQVSNFGTTEVRDVPVRLAVDGDPPSEETTIESLAPGASKSVSLFARFKTDGTHLITARISKDGMPADDSRTIVVRAIKQVQVLIVDGDPGRETRESKAFYLREALQPVDPSIRDQYFVQAKTVTPTELSDARFDEFDAVILANVADVSPASVTSLERFVSQGGGLVVFPGPNANIPFYNDTLFRKTNLIAALLGEAVGDSGQSAKFFTFQTKDYTHPIVSIWNDTGIGSMGAARFFRTYNLQIPSQTQAAAGAAKAKDIGPPRVVLRYSNGLPAVVEHSYGLGRTVLFSSGADTTWNDLPVRPKVFIPLIHRTIGSLLARQDEGMNIRVGQKFVLTLPSEMLGKDALISRSAPSSAVGGAVDNSVRDAKRVEMLGSQPALVYDKTDLAATYTATIVGSSNTFQFASQMDPVESQLDPISTEQIDQLQSVARIINWKQGTATADLLSGERFGTELWLPLAAFVVLLAASETLLAHRFSKSK